MSMGDIHQIFYIPYANPKAHHAREILKSLLFCMQFGRRNGSHVEILRFP